MICPVCKKSFEKSAEISYGPFCSKRCRGADLGIWLEGRYVIPDESISTFEDEEPTMES